MEINLSEEKASMLKLELGNSLKVNHEVVHVCACSDHLKSSIVVSLLPLCFYIFGVASSRDPLRLLEGKGKKSNNMFLNNIIFN